MSSSFSHRLDLLFVNWPKKIPDVVIPQREKAIFSAIDTHFSVNVRLKSGSKLDLVYLLGQAERGPILWLARPAVAAPSTDYRPPSVCPFDTLILFIATLFYSFDVQGSTAKLTLVFPHV